MTPKPPQETAAQKAERLRAERENVATIQKDLRSKTRFYQRIRAPRMSIASNNITSSVPLR